MRDCDSKASGIVAMKAKCASLAVLVLVACSGRAQTAKESRLNVAQFGLVKTSCVWYPGKVRFLDDDHLVISAPVAYSCDKGNRDKATDTQITVIDLQGHQLAGVRRANVVEMVAGPVGYVTVCTGDRIELLSRDLQIAASIENGAKGVSGHCYSHNRLSPSRTAVAIAGPGNGQFRLYQGSSKEPVAGLWISKGQSIAAVAEDGFLVCQNRCEVVGPAGTVRSFPSPGSGYYIVGLLTLERLLVGDYAGKHLFAETSAGDKIAVGDVAKIKPPFIDSRGAEMSAVEPRRILYQVDGCLLGDYDDCYGVVFRRFAVFDSETSTLVFRHSYAQGADLKISPNGRVVMEQSGPDIHLFRLP
jgi:hypothetical protein